MHKLLLKYIISQKNINDFINKYKNNYINENINENKNINENENINENINENKNINENENKNENINENKNENINENKNENINENENINITDIRDISIYDFKKSNIQECIINNDDYVIKLNYKLVLNKIYNLINDGTQIIKKSKLNIKTIKKENEGYYYLNNIGISIPGLNTNKYLLEIINQCIENKIKLYMKIKLSNGILIHINFLLINKINIIKIEDIKKYNFNKSIIYECLINNKKINKLKYRSILNYIYNLIDDGIIIIKNSKLNIKTIKKENEGYYYLDNIGISIQTNDNNKYLLEIINQCINNKIKLFMKIKLIDDIKIKINF